MPTITAPVILYDMLEPGIDMSLPARIVLAGQRLKQSGMWKTAWACGVVGVKNADKTVFFNAAVEAGFTKVVWAQVLTEKDDPHVDPTLTDGDQHMLVVGWCGWDEDRLKFISDAYAAEKGATREGSFVDLNKEGEHIFGADISSLLQKGDTDLGGLTSMINEFETSSGLKISKLVVVKPKKALIDQFGQIMTDLKNHGLWGTACVAFTGLKQNDLGKFYALCTAAGVPFNTWNEVETEAEDPLCDPTTINGTKAKAYVGLASWNEAETVEAEKILSTVLGKNPTAMQSASGTVH